MYIGTFTNAPFDNQPLGSRGIYAAEFDCMGEAPKLNLTGLATSAINPSFLVRHPFFPVVYSVQETKGPEYNGSLPGAVCAYSVLNSQKLEKINCQPTGGLSPTHLTVSPDGRHLVAANYTSGNVSVFSLDGNGEIGPLTQIIKNQGSGVHPGRQAGGHAHWVGFDPTGQSLWYVDLGTDRLYCYRWNAEQNEYVKFSALAVRPGSGPRHLVFPPLDLWMHKPGLVVINELSATVDFLNFDPERPSEIGFCQQSIRAYEELVRPKYRSDQLQRPLKAGAGIVLTKDARFLYVSNRDNPGAVAAFTVDWMHNTPLNRIQIISTEGLEPRFIALDPSERFLLAANQETNEIIAFSIHPDTGVLTKTKAALVVPCPSCILF